MTQQLSSVMLAHVPVVSLTVSYTCQCMYSLTCPPSLFDGLYICRSRRGGIKLSKYVSSDEDDDDDEGEASEGSEADEADEGVEAGDGGDGGDGSEGGDGAGGADDSDTDEEDVATTVAKPSNKNSSRIDDLWASFKEDVGIPAKQEKDASDEKVHVGYVE